MLSDLKGWEFLILAALVVLLFGGKRLPDAARGLGRSGGMGGVGIPPPWRRGGFCCRGESAAKPPRGAGGFPCNFQSPSPGAGAGTTGLLPRPPRPGSPPPGRPRR